MHSVFLGFRPRSHDHATAAHAVVGMPKHTAQLTAQTGAVLSHSASSPVSSGQPGQLLQFSVPDASGHEKAPSVATRRFFKLEREKRLELPDTNTEVAADQTARIDANSPGAQGDAHEKQDEKTVPNQALLRLEKSEGDRTPAAPNSSYFAPEIRELIDVWQTLKPEIRAAILMIVRNAEP